MSKIVINNIEYKIHPVYDLYAASKNGKIIHVVKHEKMAYDHMLTDIIKQDLLDLITALLKLLLLLQIKPARRMLMQKTVSKTLLLPIKPTSLMLTTLIRLF